MSFRIFTAGSKKFNFVQSNCLDDKEIDKADLLSKLQSLELTKVGAATTAADIVLPSAGAVDLMKAVATYDGLNKIDNALNVLNTCDTSGGWISLSCRQTNLVLPDNSGVTKYAFAPGDNPGPEFIKKILPVLQQTEMANWGVLQVLGNVLSRYANHIGSLDKPMLNIQLQS